ncbi:MAG: helix-turn-helix transcriptional regulator [Clostridia bacterium]|nr:helix-turn-helix transcriptional regulator [Clostridia bacterium]
MQFYNTFLKLCNSKGKSPSKVAEDIGSTRAAANRWKNGSIPSDTTFLKIADYFGVTVKYLKGEEEQETKNPSTPRDERIDDIYELVKDLSATDMVALKAFAAGLKANRKSD